jgi:quinol-cytochrome oxidoreductase complex cytochrome b subunit
LPSTTGQSGGLGGALIGVRDFLMTRVNNIDVFDEHYQNEAKTNPFYALGPIFYLVWFIVMLTGCVLIIWYVPTKSQAFDSILRIQDAIPFGGIWRGVHKYGADAMIIAATMRMYRMFLMADYKPGKEFNILVGLLALLLSMYSGLTGYLLIWNQRAFWATKVFATFPTYMDQFPIMGDFYQPLVKSAHMGWNTAEVLLGGGAAITQETITRFFSLHLAFSLIPLIFIELYFYKNALRRVPLGWVKRTVITLMLVFVSIVLPAAQGARSNPDVTPLPILSDWYFLGLYQMYKYLEPVVATEITMLIPLSVIILPFLDSFISGPEKDIMKRPVILLTSIMAFINWVAFSFLIIFNIANIHSDPPYWRGFLYCTVDVGILWQLWLMWTNPDAQQRLRSATGAFILFVVGAIQTLVAVVYFFMAQTEMFLSPVGQAWVYGALRGFAGDNAEKVEKVVRHVLPINKQYWDFHQILSPGALKITPNPAGADDMRKLLELTQQTTPLDGIFKLIPTFEPANIHPQYAGMIDFLVNNRWCADFLVFTDRMTKGVIPPYPVGCPDLDFWTWMVAGPIVMVAAFVTWVHCSSSTQAKSAPAQAVPSGT